MCRAKALPSRAHDAAIIQRFELDRVCIQSALPQSFADGARWAPARQLSGPAYYRLDKLGSLARL